MSVEVVPEQLQKWRRWTGEDIYGDVREMHFRRMIWREVGKMLDANPVGHVVSSFWDFYHANYAEAQAVAVRRQADVRRGTSSLRRLLDEIAGNPSLLTREGYVSLLGERGRNELLVQRMHRDWESVGGREWQSIRWPDCACRCRRARNRRRASQEVRRRARCSRSS